MKTVTISITLTSLMAFSFLLCFSQDFPKLKTTNHILIKGTNIYMIPPSTFELTNNFKGFQNPDDQTSMIMIVEIPGPLSEVSKGFNLEKLKDAGMRLIGKAEVQISEYSGFLLEVDQSANGIIFSKHILVYGNEKSSTLINGIYIKDSLQLGMSIKESILTTFIDSKFESNPRDALDYSFNENVGSLKFHSVIGNGMLFNRDLKTPTESADKTTLFTDKSFARIDIADKKLFCISRLKKYPEDYTMLVSKGISPIELDNLTGFELYAKSNENDDIEIYQVILFNEEGGYYLFVGEYLAGNEKAISDIKKIIQTFKKKK